MARALLGHLGNGSELLALEVARLRCRISELQAENAELRAERDLLATGLSAAAIDAELHRITTDEQVLA